MKLEDFDFRVWDEEQQSFLGENALGVAPIINILNKRVFYPFVDNNDKELNQEALEIELWTGFRDKGGVKIFAGDILHFRDKNYLVKLNKNFELSVICSIKDSVHRMHTSKGNFKNCKVIGNIHENPQLLE